MEAIQIIMLAALVVLGAALGVALVLLLATVAMVLAEGVVQVVGLIRSLKKKLRTSRGAEDRNPESWGRNYSKSCC
jgi:hypothetical protein